MTHILDKDVEFLAHFGVKGMRWGVHKKRRRQTVTRKGE